MNISIEPALESLAAGALDEAAPAEALAKFWEDLREKSRVRIEHPDLPDTLKAAAGDLVATIWIQAQAAAQEGLAAFRAEAQAAVVEAQTAKGAADDERMAAQKDLEQARLSAQAAADRTLGLERELAAERAAKEALSSQLEAAGRQQASLEMALAEARRDFAAINAVRRTLRGNGKARLAGNRPRADSGFQIAERIEPAPANTTGNRGAESCRNCPTTR
jgi:hypothetical protein